MRKFIYLMLLIPFFVISQGEEEYMVIENVMLTAIPAKTMEFEAGLAAHNKKYHAEGMYGARVYWVSSGKNAGKYIWAMGPLPWSAMDSRPAVDGHDEDWSKNVVPYTTAESDVTYWRFHPQFSNFSNDFELNYLSVFMVDFKRFKYPEMISILERVKKVNTEKNPDDTYGVYTNEMPDTKDGRDMAFVNFFSNSGWMGREDKFPKKFDEVHGEGSFMDFIKDVEVATNGDRAELWTFRKDLSGLSGTVNAQDRQ